MAGLALHGGINLPAALVVMKARFGHLMFMPGRHERLKQRRNFLQATVHGSASYGQAVAAQLLQDTMQRLSVEEFAKEEILCCLLGRLTGGAGDSFGASDKVPVSKCRLHFFCQIAGVGDFHAPFIHD